MGELSAPVALDAKDAKRARAMLARARELAKEKAPVIARSSPRTVAKAATSPFAALSEASGRTPRRR
jgi:hypothetical protein